MATVATTQRRPQTGHDAAEGRRQDTESPRLASVVASDGVAERLTHHASVPDGGWGWMVALGAFLAAFLVTAQISCFSIQFSRYLLDHDTPTTTVAWIHNSLNFLYHLMGVLLRPLAHQFGWRSVGFFSLSLTSASSLLSAFTPSPVFLFFSYSLLCGVGGGLSVTMVYTIVAPYFSNRRGRANMIVVAGAPMGTMLVSPLLHVLLDKYGFRGASLIYSAIAMNAFVGVALFHPLQWHLKRQHHQSPPAEPEGSRVAMVLHDTDSSRQKQSHCQVVGAEADLVGDSDRDGRTTEDRSDYVIQEEDGDTRSSAICSCDSEGSGQISVGALSTTATVTCPSTVSTHRRLSSGTNTRSSVHILSHTIFKIAENTKSDLYLFRNMRVIIISLSFLLHIVTYFNFFLLVPFALLAEGLSEEMSSWCLAVVGLANLGARLLFSPLADCRGLNLCYCHMLGSVLMALGTAVIAVTQQWVVILVGAAIFGVGVGVSASLLSLVIIQVMGLTLLVPVFGITVFTAALGFITLGPLIGLVRDLTGSYDVCLWVLTALNVGRFLLWLLMPAAQRRDRAKNSVIPDP